MQAAVDGLGIALGWQQLIEGYLRQGLLVKAIDASMPSTGSYFQLLRERRGVGPNVEELRRWFEREAAGGRGLPSDQASGTRKSS